MDKARLEGLKVRELQALAKAHGIAATGRKPEIVARLAAAAEAAEKPKGPAAWEGTARKVLGDGTATPFFRAMNFELFARPTAAMRSVAYTGTMMALGFPIYYYVTTSLDDSRAAEREKKVAAKKRLEEEVKEGIADPFEGLSPREIDHMAQRKPWEAQKRWEQQQEAIRRRAEQAERARAAQAKETQMQNIRQAIFKGAQPLPSMDDDKYSGMTPEEIDAAAQQEAGEAK